MSSIAAKGRHAGSRVECRWGRLCLNVCAEKGAFNAKHMCFQLLSGASPVAVTWPDKALLKYRQCGFKAVRKRRGMLFRKFFRHGQGLGCNSAVGKSDRGSSWAEARPCAAPRAELHRPPASSVVPQPAASSPNLQHHPPASITLRLCIHPPRGR